MRGHFRATSRYEWMFWDMGYRQEQVAAVTGGQVVITGGAGFLGSRLARELLAAGDGFGRRGPARAIAQLTLVDQAPVPADLAADERVTW